MHHGTLIHSCTMMHSIIHACMHAFIHLCIKISPPHPILLTPLFCLTKNQRAHPLHSFVSLVFSSPHPPFQITINHPNYIWTHLRQKPTNQPNMYSIVVSCSTKSRRADTIMKLQSCGRGSFMGVIPIHMYLGAQSLGSVATYTHM